MGDNRGPATGAGTTKTTDQKVKSALLSIIIRRDEGQKKHNDFFISRNKPDSSTLIIGGSEIAHNSVMFWSYTKFCGDDLCYISLDRVGFAGPRRAWCLVAERFLVVHVLAETRPDALQVGDMVRQLLDGLDLFGQEVRLDPVGELKEHGKIHIKLQVFSESIVESLDMHGLPIYRAPSHNAIIGEWTGLKQGSHTLCTIHP